MLPVTWRDSFHPTPLLALVGRSGSGKTTYIEKLVTRLHSNGLQVMVIKHTHHDVDDEPPGKDTSRFRHAGALATVLVSPQRAVLTWESPTLALHAVVARLPPADLILVEGYKGADVPKILVTRDPGPSPLLDGSVPGIIAIAIAIASDLPAGTQTSNLPTLDLNQPERLADWLTTELRTHP